MFFTEMKDTDRNNSLKGSPFLKWAGGKGKLLAQYARFFPKRFNRYIEPFLGGGAVFFHLMPERSILSDTNSELINCYLQLRDNPERLIEILTVYRENHQREGRDYYYHVRSLSPDSLDKTEQAARMIYLNKTCYNGLYRVNSKGLFNVPFGRYKNPGIFNRDAILKASDALRGAVIERADFRKIESTVEKDDFVYLDPPYHPLSATANFTDYTKDSFGVKDQEDLAEVFLKAHKKGAFLMHSNSDTPLIRKLYSGFYLRNIMAPRSINSRGDNRQAIPELLITNYSLRGILKKTDYE